MIPDILHGQLGGCIVYTADDTAGVLVAFQRAIVGAVGYDCGCTAVCSAEDAAQHLFGVAADLPNRYINGCMIFTAGDGQGRGILHTSHNAADIGVFVGDPDIFGKDDRAVEAAVRYDIGSRSADDAAEHNRVADLPFKPDVCVNRYVLHRCFAVFGLSGQTADHPCGGTGRYQGKRRFRRADGQVADDCLGAGYSGENQSGVSVG